MWRKLFARRLAGCLKQINNEQRYFRAPMRGMSGFPPQRHLDYLTPQVEVPTDTRVASVALIGAPNAGKSSLSNALIRNRVSAVSRKVNTTRNRIAGACTIEKRQLIFWDTPGLIEQQFVKDLGEARRELTTSGWGAAGEADVAVLIVDASRGLQYWKKCAAIAGQLASVRKRTRVHEDATRDASEEGGAYRKAALLLVLNKCDKTRPRTRLLEAAEFFQENIEGFEECFDEQVYMVSAYNGRGVDDLRDALLDRTTPGPFEVPGGMTHCDDDLSLIRQHIWEKLLHTIHQEIPYQCRFENEELEQLPNGDIYMSEVIRVPHARTVPIVIGPGGKLIRWICDKTMESASLALRRNVHLKLRVAVA